MQLQQDPLKQCAVGVGGGADHNASRRSGSDMQRGPPPPRASSLPSMVITVRCLASVQSSNARKFAGGQHPESRRHQGAQRLLVAPVTHQRTRPDRQEIAGRAPLLPLLVDPPLAAGKDRLEREADLAQGGEEVRLFHHAVGRLCAGE